MSHATKPVDEPAEKLPVALVVKVTVPISAPFFLTEYTAVPVLAVTALALLP